QSKAEFLASLRSGELKYLSVNPKEMQIRNYGATVVVTGTAAMRTQSGGQERDFRIRFLDVYVKRQGRWQMVAWQSARLAQ
ncbi:MAG: nuclear transport factor 2 family protein, partial [Gammaproteobacteria bacterium]